MSCSRIIPYISGIFLCFVIAGCDDLPPRPVKDPSGSSLNTTTSLWRGQSSSGAQGTVRQVATGLNKFTFKEVWSRGKGRGAVATNGIGTYEPTTNINIYEYKVPPGVVVAKTTEFADGITTEDYVLATTIPLFRPGEKITYVLINK